MADREGPGDTASPNACAIPCSTSTSASSDARLLTAARRRQP